MIPALAFVPTYNVIQAYERLEEEMPDEILPILDYFERVCIRRRIKNRPQRREQLYEINFWNVASRVINDDPRTNNKVEGFHNSVNVTLGFNHPTIWKFINGLKRLQNINKTKIAGLVARGPIQRKRKYIDLDNRIKTIVNDLQTGTF